MKAIFRRPQQVHGVTIARRRFTLCVPILAIAFAADTLLFMAVDKPLGTCLSVFCWAG